MSGTTKNRISEVCTALLLLLLVYTGSVKLLDYPAFRMVLHTSRWIGSFAPLVAWLLPVLELAIAVLLFIPSTRQSGLAASTMLLSLFTLYVGYMLVFEPKLPCSCGGVISGMGWPQHLLFNLFYTAIALLGWWTKASRNDRIQPMKEGSFSL
ncbi:MAG: hypothetical protein EOP50_00730 [Sphingobacteriales bacterium]|nr:MAG: hypothetical protein EOP50_00730 [Sphingobacteriales bacterium]